MPNWWPFFDVIVDDAMMMCLDFFSYIHKLYPKAYDSDSLDLVGTACTSVSVNAKRSDFLANLTLFL